MAFDQFNLFLNITALLNLKLAPILVRKRQHKDAKKEALMLRQRVGITEQAQRHSAQLFGGQHQRVAIALSMCMDKLLTPLDKETRGLFLQTCERPKNSSRSLRRRA